LTNGTPFAQQKRNAHQNEEVAHRVGEKSGYQNMQEAQKTKLPKKSITQ
jgi:hypothetical protein